MQIKIKERELKRNNFIYWILVSLFGYLFGFHRINYRTIRDILDEHHPGWQAWDYPGINGQGILSAPGLGSNGIFEIKVNGQHILGSSANIDFPITRFDHLEINNWIYRGQKNNQAKPNQVR